MKSIRIQRLRCLSDTGEIQISPITVLIGQNSSGKSTFLRFFPLLKQSLETRTSGPVLWANDLVDFGSYDDAHQKNSEKGIVFQFNFNLDTKSTNKVAFEGDYNNFIYPSEVINILQNLEISLTLQLSEDKSQKLTKLEKVFVRFSDSEIEIEFGSENLISSFKINSLDLLSRGKRYKFQQPTNTILPTITESEQQRLQGDSLLAFRLLEPSRQSDLFYSIFSLLVNKIKKNSRITSPNTIIEILNSLGLAQSTIILEKLQTTSIKTLNEITNKWDIETQDFQELRDLVIANEIPFLIKYCDQVINTFFSNVVYIKPIRLNPRRTYLFQELPIEQVDPQGNNLAIILYRLNEQEKIDFNKWTTQNLGFSILIESIENVLSIYLFFQDSQEKINLVDTGFGLSQILPIITQIWLFSRSSKIQKIRSSKIFAIEQPELHLHPRLQSLLIQALVSAIKLAQENNIDLRLILETHSEIVIHKLSHLIIQKFIDPEDINIVIFDKSENTLIKSSSFNEEGELSENWPLGFFDMDLIEF